MNSFFLCLPGLAFFLPVCFLYPEPFTSQRSEGSPPYVFSCPQAHLTWFDASPFLPAESGAAVCEFFLKAACGKGKKPLAP